MDPFMPKYNMSGLPATVKKAVSLGLELTIRDHVRSLMRMSDFILCIACDDFESQAPHIFLSEESYFALRKYHYGESTYEVDEEGREFFYHRFRRCDEESDEEEVELIIIKKCEQHLYRAVGCYRWQSRPVCVNKEYFSCIREFLRTHDRNAFLKLNYPRVMRGKVVYIQ